MQLSREVFDLVLGLKLKPVAKPVALYWCHQKTEYVHLNLLACILFLQHHTTPVKETEL